MGAIAWGRAMRDSSGGSSRIRREVELDGLDKVAAAPDVQALQALQFRLLLVCPADQWARLRWCNS